MLEHEYSLLGGVSRVKIGRYLSIMSAAMSAGLVYLLLLSVDLAKKLGVAATLPPSVLSLVGAGTIFVALYWFLDRIAWRWPLLGKILKVPDLSGQWKCTGRTLNPDREHYDWEADVTIVQSWDKIRVRLKTRQSASNSSSAALLCDEADGFRLFYSYKNEPGIGEAELQSHRGFAEIIFDKTLTKGTGEYFNGYGRNTFGTMNLERA
jgi:hypothetical protein